MIDLVLVNAKKTGRLSERKRRMIAKCAPICLAYDFGLTLANFDIEYTPQEFSEKIATSTSIGKKGKDLIELTKSGKVQIIGLKFPPNIGKTIICTSKPEEKKEITAREIYKINLSNKIALVFGCDQNQNRALRRLKKNAKHHFDVSKKGVELELDTQIGAITEILSTIRKV